MEQPASIAEVNITEASIAGAWTGDRLRAPAILLARPIHLPLPRSRHRRPTFVAPPSAPLSAILMHPLFALLNKQSAKSIDGCASMNSAATERRGK